MGKISKSKKTLALVMALVMAFTIVPFGAWGVIKASAESPNPNAVNFQLATELRDGQAYVIVDRNGQYMMTDDSKNMSSNTAKVNFGTFNVGMSVADVIAQGGLWEYDLTTTSNADDNGNVDAERFKRFSMLNNTQVWLDLYTNDEVHTFTADDCELGIEKRANGYWYIDRTSRGRDDRFLGFSYPDGIGYDNFCQQADANCQGVLIYEPIETSANEINLPVTLRDFEQNNLLFLKSGDNGPFNLNESGDYRFRWDNKNEGLVMRDFLNYAGPIENGVRKGLTKESIQNGELEYSPYAVIYLAHALRECFYGSGRGAYNVEMGTDLGNKLRDKFMADDLQDVWSDEPGHGDTHWHEGFNKQKYKASYGNNYANDNKNNTYEIEYYLYKDGGIQNFYNDLTNDPKLKGKVDSFFNGCKKDSYATYANAKTAALAALGNDLKYPNNKDMHASIMADYAYTISHAQFLTYAMITNESPFYDKNIPVYEVTDWNHIAGNWYPQTKGDPAGETKLPNSWEYIKYDENGASFMDVSWYLLHKLFNGANANGDYGTEITDKAHTLQLQKVMHADGTIAYVYDSSYKTANNFNDNGVIRNTGLTKDDSTGIYNKNPNFEPVGDNNYAMTLQGKGKFVYSKADNLYFDFDGDDDVFLYINGHRTKVDLGGIHGNKSARINLEDIVPGTNVTYAQNFGLKEGQIYDFDFFYMERCPKGSNLRMETNIVVTDASVLAQKKAYRTPGSENTNIYTEGSTVKDGTPVYYELAVNNLDVTGGSSISDVVLEDETLGIKLSANQNDIKLGNSSKLDLSKMVLGYSEVDGQGMPTNKTYREEVGNNPAKIAAFFTKYGTKANMYAGTSLWADNIKYTMDRDTLSSTNGVLTNTMKATAKVHPVVGDSFVEKTSTDSFTMKLFDVVNKTFVTDFMGGSGVKYTKDVLFTGADETREGTTVNLTSQEGTNGGKLFYNSADGSCVYRPADVMNGIDDFFFTVSVNNNGTFTEDTKRVSFVPANNIYYDDDFTGQNANGNEYGIKYGAGWTVKSGASGVFSGVGGTDVIYGNNPNFGDDVTYSGKTIHSIVGNGSKVTASLDFSGQGATVYMKTTANSGSMVAQLFNKKDMAKPVRTLMVNLTGQETLNSVPAVNFLDLPYGDYEIRLTINAKAGTETYLDGIRVYLPLGSDNAYYNPSEHNAQFIEIRDNVVNVAEIDKLVDEAILGGALYIDGTSGVATLADYTKEGPKNEIYLAQNQGITFKIDGYQEGKMFVQVGARMLKGDAGKLSFDSDTATGTDITSATDMFYKVTVQPSGLVTITNTGDGVVALTNLKVTGAMAPKAKMVVSRAIADEAIEYLNTAPVEPEVPETPTEPETPVVPQNPFEKFFNDIRDFFNKLFGIK